MEATMAGEDLLCVKTSYDDATGDALHSGHPIQHAPVELKRDSGSMLAARDSGSMSLGASLL
jgi:hypothetical protein